MNKVSVYTSLFNVENDLFDIPDALANWSKYADEIIVATLEGQARKTCKALSNHGVKTKVVEVATDLNDPFFDGKLKNAALQACKNKVVIQQDFDERIGGGFLWWSIAIEYLLRNNPHIKSLMIPVIDLYQDHEHYKGVGKKWYLHIKEGCYRGPWKGAKREDGTIDTNRSDTCELIDEKGDLCPFAEADEFLIPDPDHPQVQYDPRACHIIHLGYLDLDKRVENNKFWEPVWSARNGEDVEVPQTREEVEMVCQAKKHYLKPEWWKNDK